MGRQPLPSDTILGNGSDQYRIDTVLGPGGFGVTYLARDLRFERDVAIKEYFPAEFAYREGTTTIRSSTRGGQHDYFEQGKRHFIDEARTLGKFRHEHIVRVLNLFEQFNTAYMVLEFEEGQSFKHWLRSLGRRPTQAELDRILEPMLQTLDVIHGKGMFHRDIAPDNIIVRPNGQPVLIDFGAARNFVRESSFTVGAIVKHGYSPPEQYTLDTKLQGAWSDIYSLSATMYFAVMGEAPAEASSRQINDTTLPIEDHLDGYHRGLYRPSFIAALNAGLILRPNDRPATVAALRAVLEEPLVRALPAVARRTIAESKRGRVSDAATRGEHAGGTVLRSVRAEAPIAERSVSSRRSVPRSAIVAEPSVEAPAAVVSDVTSAQSAYSEPAARAAGIVALVVAALSALGFLMIGGIDHPGGLAAAMLACAGLVATGLERAVAVARVEPVDVARTGVTAAVMSALALAVAWLPLFLWPVSLLLVGAAALYALVSFGRWVPLTLLMIALLHLAVAVLLLLLATRSTQKDPYFLPMVGVSLGLLASLVLAMALQMQKRWEPAVT